MSQKIDTAVINPADLPYFKTMGVVKRVKGTNGWVQLLYLWQTTGNGQPIEYHLYIDDACPRMQEGISPLEFVQDDEIQVTNWSMLVADDTLNKDLEEYVMGG